MDVNDLFDWLTWGVLAFAEAISRIRRRRSKAPLSTDQLLATVPDVPYEPGPASAAADGNRDTTCVICLAAYEVGESCFVLPNCKHMFHKACIATWFRKHVTCPLCRAIVVADLPERQKLNAAENMV